jgi:hypothetical protein
MNDEITLGQIPFRQAFRYWWILIIVGLVSIASYSLPILLSGPDLSYQARAIITVDGKYHELSKWWGSWTQANSNISVKTHSSGYLACCTIEMRAVNDSARNAELDILKAIGNFQVTLERKFESTVPETSLVINNDNRFSFLKLAEVTTLALGLTYTVVILLVLKGKDSNWIPQWKLAGKVPEP